MADMQKIRVDLRDMKNLECEKCNGVYFTQVFQVKVIPRLLIPGSLTDVEHNVIFNKCAACGHVNDQDMLEKNPSGK